MHAKWNAVLAYKVYVFQRPWNAINVSIYLVKLEKSGNISITTKCGQGHIVMV